MKSLPKVPIKPEIFAATTGTPEAKASDKTLELPSIFEVMQRSRLCARRSRVFLCDS